MRDKLVLKFASMSLQIYLRISLSKFVALMFIGPMLSVALMPFSTGIFNLVAADSNLSESVTQAQCRGSCLHTFTRSGGISRDEQCNANTDCYMCWNSCRLLQGDSPARPTLCADHTACFPGCKTACKFYEESTHKNLTPPLLDTPPLLLPASMVPPRLTNEGRLVWVPPNWPKGSWTITTDEVIVYIVMVSVGGRWEQHIQTSSTEAIIPSAIQNTKMRVLAVTSSGLVAYSERLPNDLIIEELVGPLPPKSWTEVKNLPDTTTSSPSPSSGGITGKISLQDVIKTVNEAVDNSDEKKLSYDYELDSSDAQPPSVPIDHSWEVTLNLLTVDLLASVEVSWEVRGSGQVDYMVTWTEAAGGISGHLVSQQNVVEISLWIGQKYSIQIELLDQHGNSVLRSVPEAISFQPETSTETQKQMSQSTSKSSPTLKNLLLTSTSRSPSRPNTDDYSHLFRASEERHREFREHLQEERERESNLRKEEPQDITTHKDKTGSNSFNFEDDSLRRFNNTLLKRHNVSDYGVGFSQGTLTNSQSVNNIGEPEEEESSIPLMAWAACLGIGAVVILILIVLAVRTLKLSHSKRQQLHRTDDYLSETTSSSVNSTSSTSASRLTRSQCSRDDEEPWSYESLYGVTDQPPNKIIYYRHPPPIHPPPPPPPIPFSSPHIHPSISIQPTSSSQLPLCSLNNPAGRIDNPSLIENYILSLDPSPVLKQVHY